MSYSLESKCVVCKKGPIGTRACTDERLLQGAINTIHTIEQEHGHMGYGNVKLDCGGFEEK